MVSSEFRSHRELLKADLERAGVHVEVQERWGTSGGTTVEKVDGFLQECAAVIHVIGDAVGEKPPAAAVDALLQRHPRLKDELGERVGLTEALLREASYTQWEAYLAVFHRRPLHIFISEPDTTRASESEANDAARQQQAEHLNRIRNLGRDRGRFTTAERLSSMVLADLRQILPGPQGKPQNLPFQPLGTLFKGRDQFLRDLRAKLTAAGQHAAAITPPTGRPKALYGAGGVGKTRAAIEYAWKHQDDYTALLFVTADSPESLETNLAQLTGVLGMSELDAADHPTRLRAALDWLHAHRGWLVILDNVDSDDAARAVRQSLARLCNGHVLITSRIAHWTAGVEPVDLDVLDVESARDYLLEATDPHRRRQASDAEDAELVATDVGQLSLGLEHAAAFINEQGWTLARYHEEWEARQGSILDAFNLQEVEYPRQVLVTWQMSVDRVSELARELLGVLSWFAPDPIPESLIEEVPNDSERRLRAAFNELVKYSLVRRDREAPVFTVHGLVKATTQHHQRRKDDDAVRNLGKALWWLDAAMAGDSQDVRNWPKLEVLQPHADAVCDAAEELAMDPAEYPTLRVLSSSAGLYLYKARFAQAEPRLRRALRIAENAYGSEHHWIATYLNNLAQLLQATKRMEDAEPLMRTALRISESTYGPDHPGVARDLNNLASLLLATNRLAEAEPLMVRALGIDESAYGVEHPNVATDLNNLALLLKDTNRASNAERLLNRALSIDEGVYGPDHPRVAIRLNNLAVLLKDMGRLAEAEPLIRRALSIDERAYGPVHSRIATRLTNLALLLQATKRMAEAGPLMRRALCIDESVFGPEHPNVAIRLQTLALLLQATNRLAEAEPLMRRALSIDEGAYGPEHPQVTIDRNNLTLLSLATNRMTEAQPRARQELGIAERAYGREHPIVALRLSGLAVSLQATNRLAEAEPLMARSVRIFASLRHKTGLEPPAFLLENYTVLLQAMGRSDDEIRVALEQATGVQSEEGSDV